SPEGARTALSVDRFQSIAPQAPLGAAEPVSRDARCVRPGAIAAANPGARIELPDAEHLSNLECPDAFSELIAPFLGEA
ncbi:alpha/beta fold hydrolase, partial [Sporosarcina koreensis]|uniref:alpha/beta fold hydrolase n=1 Tax=Sporosarcina koreensis TaxID=334735 RepID=UPI000B279B8B